MVGERHGRGMGTARYVLIDLEEGHAIPVQAWTGSEGSRRLRLPDFKKVYR